MILLHALSQAARASSPIRATNSPCYSRNFEGNTCAEGRGATFRSLGPGGRSPSMLTLRAKDRPLRRERLASIYYNRCPQGRFPQTSRRRRRGTHHRKLRDFDQGKMTRRQLIQSLALAATAVSAAGAAPAAAAADSQLLKATYINHVSYHWPFKRRHATSMRTSSA